MAEINLNQNEADSLIAMEKIKTSDDDWKYPVMGGQISVPLTSKDKRENFILDIWRNKIDLKKGHYQNRAHQTIILVRLDFGGQPHRNPDDQEIPSPHLHIYKEGFGDKWAIKVPVDKFSNMNDLWQTLHDFYKYCNITEAPNIIKELFV